VGSWHFRLAGLDSRVTCVMTPCPVRVRRTPGRGPLGARLRAPLRAGPKDFSSDVSQSYVSRGLFVYITLSAHSARTTI